MFNKYFSCGRLLLNDKLWFMKNLLYLLVIGSGLNLSAWSQTPGSGILFDSHVKNRFLILQSDQKNAASGYNVSYIRFNLYIDPAVEEISGYVATLFKLTQPRSSIQMELSDSFTIDSIVYQQTHLTFHHASPYYLTIFFMNELAAGTSAEIAIYYHGIPSPGQGFGSTGRLEHQGVPSFWTLSEPYGARDWWPGKNDLTDKADSADIIIRTPQQYRVASNGVLIRDEIIGNVRYNQWKHRYPIVPYLIGVAVTNYAVYTDTAYSEGIMVPVVNYVYPENLSAFQIQSKPIVPLMEFFSNLFTPYPFVEEKYGQAQIGKNGGMEHQTMTFLGQFDFEIMAHELAHQWFGDMVTLNSWHDIWLNEGFATYCTGLCYENMFNGYYWPIWKQWNLESVTSLPGGSVYVEDTTNVRRIFDSRLSYSKGALVLHMLRWVMGDEAFITACKNYLTDAHSQYGFASNEQLIAHMEAAAHMDLTEFFADWYYGEGFPSYLLEVTPTGHQHYRVELSQTTSHPSVSFFEMPVPVKLVGTEKDTVIILDHRQNHQVYEIDPGFEIQSAVIDPDQWLISANNEVLLDIPEANPYIAIKVYPNPAAGQIRVSAPNTQGQLLITDLTGRVVLQLDNFDRYARIDVSNFTQGSYFVHLTAKGLSADASFIKM